eukprot:CAMPEP_0170774266 /NCGR_PEP_ID=MMETSP0733-20121128/9858_1 /TAXON_ID=186038 /ORGANISM="Fragilariopsis kerguelensis, Strain L26-C5" /LENGTH=50 /DNA_ID=CAMNT_0011116795 /DNA_START=536 /DNA_END=685 /DNA_ORIENTATION=-
MCFKFSNKWPRKESPPNCAATATATATVPGTELPTVHLDLPPVGSSTTEM